MSLAVGEISGTVIHREVRYFVQAVNRNGWLLLCAVIDSTFRGQRDFVLREGDGGDLNATNEILTIPVECPIDFIYMTPTRQSR